MDFTWRISLLVLFSLPTLIAMENINNTAKIETMYVSGGPMNTKWFEDENTPYYKANQFIENRQWDQALIAYEKIKKEKNLSGYEQDMIAINQASALFANNTISHLWGVFDRLIKERKNRIKGREDFENIKEEESVFIDTDQVGIGDIACFHKVLEEVPGKKTMSVKGFLHKTFEGLAKAYNVTLVKPGEVDPESFDRSTHIISLLGHGSMNKAYELSPDRVLLTVTEQCYKDIRSRLQKYSDKKKIIVFVGKDAPAPIMGGKTLRKRHWHARSLEKLLDKHSDLMIVSGNPGHPINCEIATNKKNNATIHEKYQDRLIQIGKEDFAFDRTIGLALAVNEEGNIVSNGNDTGPFNVYKMNLNENSKNKTALFLRDPDMRVSGVGNAYRTYDGVWAYVMNDENEEDVVMGAYEDL